MPGQIKPGQIKPGQTKPGQTKLGQTKLGQTKPGQIKPGLIKPGQIKPSQAKPGEGEAVPGMSKSSSLTSLDDLRASGSWRLSQVSSLAEWRTTSRLHRPRAGERGDPRGHASASKRTSPRAHSGAGGYQHGRRATFTHQSLDPCYLVVYSKRKRRRSILRRLSRAPSSTAYTCGGRFLRDLFELCRERHLPDVPHVVVIRTSQDSSHDPGLKESRKPGSLVKRRQTPSRQCSIQRSVPTTPMASSTSLASAATQDLQDGTQ
ncbi:hypothetical protein ACOMHN_028712 [Nucella lapillus]